MTKQVIFLNTLCDVNTSYTYANKRIAIELTEAETGELMCIATVNIPDVHIEVGQVIIKDYSENEGIFKTLCKAGIIEPTGKSISTGMVTCPIGRLTT